MQIFFKFFRRKYFEFIEALGSQEGAKNSKNKF